VLSPDIRPDGHYYAPRRSALRKLFTSKGFEITLGPDAFNAAIHPERLTYQHKGFFEFHDWYLLTAR